MVDRLRSGRDDAAGDRSHAHRRHGHRAGGLGPAGRRAGRSALDAGGVLRDRRRRIDLPAERRADSPTAGEWCRFLFSARSGSWCSIPRTSAGRSRMPSRPRWSASRSSCCSTMSCGPTPPSGICCTCWPPARRGLASGSRRWVAATSNRRARAPLPRPSLEGAMSAHLALLSRADRENLSPLRHARLLAAVSVSERMRLEVERLLIDRARAAAASGSRDVQAAVAGDTRRDRRGAGDRRTVARERLDQAEDAMPDTAGPIYSMLEAYNRRVGELHPQFIVDARPDEAEQPERLRPRLAAHRPSVHPHSNSAGRGRPQSAPPRFKSGCFVDRSGARALLPQARRRGRAGVRGRSDHAARRSDHHFVDRDDHRPADVWRFDAQDDSALRRRRARRNSGDSRR